MYVRSAALITLSCLISLFGLQAHATIDEAIAGLRNEVGEFSLISKVRLPVQGSTETARWHVRAKTKTGVFSTTFVCSKILIQYNKYTHGYQTTCSHTEFID